MKITVVKSFAVADPWKNWLFVNFRPVQGCLTVPNTPGWGVERNEAEAPQHLYGEKNFLRLFEEGWKTRRPSAEA
jgi:L-alanine-DL-glutamate epimerase-like enolase superfamily enzyme